MIKEEIRTCEHSGATFTVRNKDYEEGFNDGLRHAIKIIEQNIESDPIDTVKEMMEGAI